MTEACAVTWLARGAAVASALAALELIAVRRALADDGVFAWPVLRREWPRRGLADRVLSYRGTLAVLIVQLAAALALPWLDAAAWPLFACLLIVSVRFRGSYNGGSDAMLLIVVLAVALARSGLARAGLAYAAAQLVLSYFVSGIAKLRDPRWRAGRALAIVVRLPHYRVPPRIVAALARPRVARLAGWAMLAFECSFPLALVSVPACVGFLAVGAAFHLANAVSFGLNRFWWAWLAAYPALLYAAGAISAARR